MRHTANLVLVQHLSGMIAPTLRNARSVFWHFPQGQPGSITVVLSLILKSTLRVERYIQILLPQSLQYDLFPCTCTD